MDIPKEFLEMVDNDILRINQCLNQGREQQWQLFIEIDGKYQSCIDKWCTSFWGSNKDGTQINYVISSEYSDYIKDNLLLAKSKLISFKYGMNVISLPELPSTQVNINNTNTITMDITFESARSKVEDMTSLTDDETEELIERINEIETVFNSNDKKKLKWKRVAPIVKWIADKSFDVAMVLLPLILKLQEQ